jgi:hypothetical protein
MLRESRDSHSQSEITQDMLMMIEKVADVVVKGEKRMMS